MKRFLWKIAGGDCDILNHSGKDSQYSFLVIGGLYLFIIVLTFIGFFGLFWGLFRGTVDDPHDHTALQLVSALTGSIVLSFLVSNVYFLNLMSLEPKTLPVPKDDGPLWITNIVRYSTVVLFAFFVSKNIEVELFNLWHSMGVFNFDYHDGYMDNLIRMNKVNPGIWLVTILVIGIFILPVYLKHRLNRANEYYMYKRLRDKVLVKGDYDWFVIVREEILSKHYHAYLELLSARLNNQFTSERKQNDPQLIRIEKFLKSRKLSPQHKQYSDEPFNTKPKKKEEVSYGSSDEFLDAVLLKK